MFTSRVVRAGAFRHDKVQIILTNHDFWKETVLLTFSIFWVVVVLWL